jgi:TolA-binding protein
VNTPQGVEKQGGVQMRRRFPILVLAFFTAGAVSGCAGGLKQAVNDQTVAIEAMQARLDQLAQQDEASSQEMEAIRRDIAQIGMKVTQAEDEVGELNRKTENVSTRLSLLTDEVTRMKQEGAAPPTGEVLQFGDRPPPAAGNLQAIYDSGLRLYNDNPREAIGVFAQVLEMAPASDLADNAEYWTGECYYKLEEFQPALDAFKRVFNHPGSNKMEDAQLKIGMTYRMLNRRDEAIAAFREYLSKYPDGQHVADARRHLAELGG